MGGSRILEPRFSNEFQLMLQMLSHENQPQSISTESLNQLDWRGFLTLIRHHRVYPLIYTFIKKHRLEDRLPIDLMQELQRDYMLNAFQMLHLAGEMDRVYGLFQSSGIRSIMLKGPVTGEALYGDVSLRTSKDLDLIVPMDQIDSALEALLQGGYQVALETPRIFDDWKYRFHHICLTHTQLGVHVELHWRLNPDSGYEPDFEALWARRTYSRLSTKHLIPILGEEDLLLYLCCHGAQHGWFRLRWLVDMDRLLKRPLQWRQLQELMPDYHNAAAMGQMVLLASQLFATPIPEPLAAAAHSRQSAKLARQAYLFFSSLISDPRRDYAVPFRKYLFGLKSQQQRKAYILRGFIPRSQDAARLPLPRPLHFVHYAIRPFLLIWRWFKRQTSYKRA